MDLILKQQEIRVGKLSTILKSIRNCEKDFQNAVEEKLISEIQLRWGCARRTALEYLSTLEAADKIVREGGIVWTHEGYKAHLDALESIQASKIKKQE